MAEPAETATDLTKNACAPSLNPAVWSPPHPGAAPDEMTEAFFDWLAENHRFLDVGLPGDLLDLRSRLNAAFAKASS